MAIVGAVVTVTVEGFGSKSGTIDGYDRSGHPATPYHVEFHDGLSGWFNASQVSFDEFAKKESGDPIANLAARMLKNPRPYTPHYYSTQGEEDEEDYA